MSITFNQKTQQFYLHTAHTSYVMEVYQGRLAHTYWGARVSKAPLLDEMTPFGFGASFSASDMPGRRIDSTDKLPQEFPTFGSADLREPAFHGHYGDGSAISKFFYHSHRIFTGKSRLSGLPATYGAPEECETLEIDLLDELTGLAAVLSYSIFPEKDVLTRSVRVENRGEKDCTIEAAASCSLDVPGCEYQVIHLPGAWARERQITRTDLSGSIVLDSKRGASSHNQNPFFALVSPETTETFGEAMGFCLVYSGNFSAKIGVEQFGTTRVQMGLNPFDISWKLTPGEFFQTPEVIMVYSDQGLGEMTRRFHGIIRKNLCRGKYRDAVRPVLINNWEATYFDFDEQKIMNIAAKARELGVELMVLDDGWFGKRNSDDCSLGDWTVNTEKLPGGLLGLAEKINGLGMKFGLWFEPEMVSPDSDLYRQHPDWCIHTEGRPRTEGRRQLILDYARPEVCDYILHTLSEILRENPIVYVKWDMNRNMTEVAYAGQTHRYMLGLYSVLETLTEEFPDVLFESCSGGGGRFDAGMLYYMPQTWTSDDTDAVERLYIQEGTSLVYPLSTMGAHVSAVPNHQVGRVTPLAFRGAVAMMGRYGLELDLEKLREEELTEISRQIAFYQDYQQVIHQGELYRLASPYHQRFAAYEIVSEDSHTVLVFFYNVKGRPNVAPRQLRLQGLLPDARYRDKSTGLIQDGSTWMNIGIPIDTRYDMTASVRVLERCETEEA